jgi:hypothetical protein
MKAKQKPKTKPKRRPQEWTNRDQLAAEKEGWAIFDVYGGGLQEIERDDERNKFKSDETALAHVYRRALAGSRLHIRALVIHCRDAIDVFKAAHGYGEEDEVPQNATGSGGRYARYNHQFSVAYNVNSNERSGEDATGLDHRAALIARADELAKMDADELREAVEKMDDGYENECLSAGGWPPDAEASEDITTTG